MLRSSKGHKYILCVTDEVTNYMITTPMIRGSRKSINK